jgi:hypothetical protein
MILRSTTADFLIAKAQGTRLKTAAGREKRH